MIELWSINKYLRYTGWRLFVSLDKNVFLDGFDPDKLEPTRIGLAWYGWGFLKKV